MQHVQGQVCVAIAEAEGVLAAACTGSAAVVVVAAAAAAAASAYNHQSMHTCGTVSAQHRRW